jgi:hypothetical protein
MNVKKIVLEKINAVGADGLCSPECNCHCKKDELFEYCDERLYHDWSDLLDCVLAKAVLKRDYCTPDDCELCDGWENCDGFLEASITDAKRSVPMEEKQ